MTTLPRHSLEIFLPAQAAAICKRLLSDTGEAAAESEVGQAELVPKRRRTDDGDEQAIDRAGDGYAAAGTGVAGYGECVVSIGGTSPLGLRRRSGQEEQGQED